MLERSRLMQERTLALRRQDYGEVSEIDARLEEANKISSPPVKQHDSGADLLTKVNERNRKANVEAVRRAELAETERKRRERKLATTKGGTPTPTDPSARLKTLPKTFNAATR
jgi:RNA polymerase-associated protein RTF1